MESHKVSASSDVTLAEDVDTSDCVGCLVIVAKSASILAPILTFIPPGVYVAAL